LIEEPDRNKTKDEGMRGAPEPKILVQEIERYHSNDKEGSFHVFLKNFLASRTRLNLGKAANNSSGHYLERQYKTSNQKTLIVVSERQF
jgi:hypothetical protein